MQNINIKKIIYHLRWRYMTLNNAVLVIALVIGANWAWGSIEMMQRNYTLQKTLELKQREKTIAELQTDKLAYEQRYYQSSEYKELAARRYLGLADPGEKVLILPPNSPEAKKEPTTPTAAVQASSEPPSNLKQWTSFLFGGNHRSLRK